MVLLGKNQYINNPIITNCAKCQEGKVKGEMRTFSGEDIASSGVREMFPDLRK